jgi:transposase
VKTSPKSSTTIRDKGVRTDCKTLVQAPVPAELIDNGIPTADLLAHVLVATGQFKISRYRRT